MVGLDMFFCFPCLNVYRAYQSYKQTFGERFPMKMPNYRDRVDRARIEKFRHLESSIYMRQLSREAATKILKPMEGEAETLKPIENFEKEIEKTLGVKSLESIANSTKDSDEGYDSKKNSPNIEIGVEEGKNGSVKKSNTFIEAVIEVMNKKPLLAIKYEKYETDLKLNEENKENEAPQKAKSLPGSKYSTPNGMQAPLLDGSVPPRKLDQGTTGKQVFTPRRKLEFEANQ